MKILKDLGLKYPTPKSKKKARYVLCECPVCKKEIEANYYNVKSGLSKKCRSCATRESNITHGKADIRIYKIWINMKQRCLNKKNTRYSDYGGRGIRISKEWIKSFESFNDWAMLSGYNDSLTLERIDVNGNYEPSNCTWITLKEQAKNKRVKIARINNNPYRGVRKIGNKYEARKTVNKVYVSLGLYTTKDEAREVFLNYENNLLINTK